ncbi:MAG: hypothetical protein FWD26_00770 [Treponema sp.]|nr:hypothetical protein [Treponema sp.]
MKKVFFLLLVSVFSYTLWAQSRDSAPHITGIQVEVRSNLIRLSWVDSPDARGPVYIFRSARPFAGSVPANIRPVIVRYGQEYYIDDTDDMENVYYFIAASDLQGRRFELILPMINSTSLNVVQSPERELPLLVQAPSEPIRGISNLKAAEDGERVIITYDATGPRRNPILYRSIQPIRQPQDLLNAVIVTSGMESPFIDFPVPGITWYYAVIYEDEIATGSMGIRPGVNSTETPVTITAELAAERSIRPMPLPILSLRSTMPQGFFAEVPPQIPLGPGAVNMLRDIQMPQKQPLAYKNPRIFSVDMEAPTGGEESALFQILTEYFVNFEWEKARISLQYYLSLPRSAEVEARARFYLGQTLYFTHKYREALMEFLTLRNIHPIEANGWIDAVLTAMVY